MEKKGKETFHVEPIIYGATGLKLVPTVTMIQSIAVLKETMALFTRPTFSPMVEKSK